MRQRLTPRVGKNSEYVSKKVAILGTGDLGKRIAFGLAASNPNISLSIAGRNSAKTSSLASLLSACQGREVGHFCCDGTDSTSVKEFLEASDPDVLIQAASLISPWAAFNSQNLEVMAFKASGFAANLAAQIPIVLTVMRNVKESGAQCAVVNCSYPDVTGPILSTMRLAPTVGIGNVGMLRRIIAVKMPIGSKPLRVFAHHSQVWPFLLGENGKHTLPVKVFVGDREVTNEINFSLPSIVLDRDLNALAAAHAIDVVLGLTGVYGVRSTAAPGVHGLPGGWPVRISEAKVELDMPSNLSVKDLEAFQNHVGKLEGISRIDPDGTVFFTDRLYDNLPDAYKILGMPLHPDQATERSMYIQELVSKS